MVEGMNLRNKTRFMVVITLVILISASLIFIQILGPMDTVIIELDYGRGIDLDFTKFNLSSQAIENFSVSSFFLCLEFPAFNESAVYLFNPSYNDTNHMVTGYLDTIIIENVQSYEDEKEYPFIIKFEIDSPNDEIKNLVLLNGNNSIHGTIRFDLASDDVDFFDGDYLVPQTDERNLDFAYPPNGVGFRFVIAES